MLVQTSLHQRIRADIEARILSGEWAPGHRLPFEHELMAQYGCARMTVNEAMSALANAGLIERRRRAGSFVRAPGGQSAILEIPDIKAEITARGQLYGYELLSYRRRRATGADTQHIAVRAGADLLLLRCRHRAGPSPFALEERRIALAAVPEAARTDFAANAPGTWLLQHVPWHEAEHKIAACNANVALPFGMRRACRKINGLVLPLNCEIAGWNANIPWALTLMREYRLHTLQQL